MKLPTIITGLCRGIPKILALFGLAYLTPYHVIPDKKTLWKRGNIQWPDKAFLYLRVPSHYIEKDPS